MNLKTPLTLLVLVAILLGGAFFAWKTVLSPDDENDQPKPVAQACAHRTSYSPGDVIKSSQVAVSVHNAGVTSGLASDTLQALEARGFKGAGASNGSGGFKVKNVTIAGLDRHDPQARLLGRQFKGKIRYVVQETPVSHVDVYVGNGFKRLAHQSTRQIKVAHAISLCTAG